MHIMQPKFAAAVVGLVYFRWLAVTSSCVDTETVLLILMTCRHQLAPPGAKRRAASVWWKPLPHTADCLIPLQSPLLPPPRQLQSVTVGTGCRLNSGDRFIIIVEVRRPGHGEPVQFDSSSAVHINRQRLPTTTMWQQWQSTMPASLSAVGNDSRLWVVPHSMKWLSTSRGRDGNPDSPSNRTNSSSSGHLPFPHIDSAWLSSLRQQQGGSPLPVWKAVGGHYQKYSRYCMVQN